MKSSLVLSRNLILFILTLLIISCGPSQERLDKIAEEKKQIELEIQRVEQAELEIQHIEQARLDTIDLYSIRAQEHFKKNKISEAIFFLDTALSYTNKKEKDKLISKRASYYFKVRKYHDAIIDYTKLINNNVKPKSNYYERALCYEKLNKRQEAVNDLKEAIVFNNEDADKLHNRINPIKKTNFILCYQML
jgi:tetratricopeptide (TPR) repeat protein